MFNFKVCGIAAGAAFILSLMISLLSGAGFFIGLLRAFLFASLFFALFGLGFWLINQFVPDLLAGGDDDLDIPGPGSRINITVGPINGAFPKDDSESVDAIDGSPAGGAEGEAPGRTGAPLDQNNNSGYNKERGPVDGLGSFSAGGLTGGPEFSPEKADGSASVPDGAALPDMGSMTEGFAPQPETLEGGIVPLEIPEQKRRSSSNSGRAELAGDYHPKELAQAVQTVLKKDEKG